MTCLYISPHGETNLDRMMIVPENTFVIYIGQSGFQTLVSHGAYWLLTAESRAAYFQSIYDVYVSGRSHFPARPYRDQHVFVPGDVLPNTIITLKSGRQNIYNKGVYECPVRNAEDFKIEDPKKGLTIQLAEWDNQGLLPRDPDGIPSVFREAGMTNAKAELWKEFRGKEIQERIATYDNYSSNLNWFFMGPDIIVDKVINPILIDHPDELLGKEWILGKRYETSVSEILERVNPHPEKKYRFVIVSACRGPQSAAISFASYSKGQEFPHPNPVHMANLYANRIQPSRLARRFSFSAKPMNLPPLVTGAAGGAAGGAGGGESEGTGLCALYDDEPMNIKKIYDVYSKFFRVRSSLEENSPEEDFIGTLYTCFFNRINTTTLKYATTFRTVQFATLLNMLFYPYPILSTPDHPAHALFKKLLETTQTTFGTFLIGLHVDQLNKDQVRSLGESLLRHRNVNSAGPREDLNANRAIYFPKPTNAAGPYSTILARQKAFLERPNWAPWKRASGFIELEEEDRAFWQLLFSGRMPRQFQYDYLLGKLVRAYRNIEGLGGPLLKDAFSTDVPETHKTINRKLVSLQGAIDTHLEAATEYNIAYSNLIKKEEEIVRKYSGSTLLRVDLAKSRAANVYEAADRVLDEAPRGMEMLLARKRELEAMKAALGPEPRPAPAVAQAPPVAQAPAAAKRPVVVKKPAKTAVAPSLLNWRAGYALGNRGPTNTARLQEWARVRQGMTEAQRKAQNRNLKARTKALRNSRAAGGRRRRRATRRNRF